MREESKEGGAGWVLESDRGGPTVAKGRRQHGQDRSIPLSLRQDFEESKYHARVFLKKWGWAVYPVVMIGLVVLAVGTMHLAFRAHKANMVAKHGVKKSAFTSPRDSTGADRARVRTGQASSNNEPVTFGSGGREKGGASRGGKEGSSSSDALGMMDPEGHLGRPLVQSDCDEMVLAAATIRLKDIDKTISGSHVGEGGHEDIMQEMVNSQQHMAIARKEHRHLTKLLAACEARKLRIARELEFQKRSDEARAREDEKEGQKQRPGTWKFAGEAEGDAKPGSVPASNDQKAARHDDASQALLGHGD